MQQKFKRVLQDRYHDAIILTGALGQISVEYVALARMAKQFPFCHGKNDLKTATLLAERLGLLYASQIPAKDQDINEELQHALDFVTPQNAIPGTRLILQKIAERGYGESTDDYNHHTEPLSYAFHTDIPDHPSSMDEDETFFRHIFFHQLGIDEKFHIRTGGAELLLGWLYSHKQYDTAIRIIHDRHQKVMHHMPKLRATDMRLMMQYTYFAHTMFSLHQTLEENTLNNDLPWEWQEPIIVQNFLEHLCNQENFDNMFHHYVGRFSSRKRWDSAAQFAEQKRLTKAARKAMKAPRVARPVDRQLVTKNVQK